MKNQDDLQPYNDTGAPPAKGSRCVGNNSVDSNDKLGAYQPSAQPYPCHPPPSPITPTGDNTIIPVLEKVLPYVTREAECDVRNQLDAYKKK
jgi:hypothetical protein